MSCAGVLNGWAIRYSSLLSSLLSSKSKFFVVVVLIPSHDFFFFFQCKENGAIILFLPRHRFTRQKATHCHPTLMKGGMYLTLTEKSIIQKGGGIIGTPRLSRTITTTKCLRKHPYNQQTVVVVPKIKRMGMLLQLLERPPLVLFSLSCLHPPTQGKMVSSLTSK